MSDEQFDIIVSLLEGIKSAIENVEANTGPNMFIEDHVRETVTILKEIKGSI